MSNINERYKEATEKGLEVIIRALDGEEVTPAELAAAKVAAPMELKRQSNQNGHNRNMISLMKIGITDKAMRERVALDVLKTAGIEIPAHASGPLVPEPRLALETVHPTT